METIEQTDKRGIRTMTQQVTELWKKGNRGNNIEFAASLKRIEKEEPGTYKLLTFTEGFTCEDSNYIYRLGKSKWGLWLSRSPLQTTSTTVNQQPLQQEPMMINVDSKPPARPDLKQAALDIQELGLTAVIKELTTSINNLIYCWSASTEQERQEVKRKIQVVT
ncbi:MAG: hypothetical protein M3044_06615 [Thermoproteota archaeon]|nr:hypothetical protein [Thermoproteota archaeon]